MFTISKTDFFNFGFLFNSHLRIFTAEKDIENIRINHLNIENDNFVHNVVCMDGCEFGFYTWRVISS